MGLSGGDCWPAVRVCVSVCVCVFSWPSGWKHRHTVPDQQNRAWQNSQTVDQAVRHIDPRRHPPPLPPTRYCTSLPLAVTHSLSKHTHKVQQDSCLPAPQPPTPPSSLTSIFSVYWKKTNIPFVRHWLESFFFYTKRRLFDFYFPISECWKCVREKSVGRVSLVSVLRSCSRKRAESMLWFRFPSFISILPAWNRKLCSDGSFLLLNFRSFCLYCMYFFRGFWGRPQTFRSACERGGTCIFPGYPPRLRLQSGLLCTCITEAPNKNTLWLACDKLSGSLFHGLRSGHEHARHQSRRRISSSWSLCCAFGGTVAMTTA